MKKLNLLLGLSLILLQSCGNKQKTHSAHHSEDVKVINLTTTVVEKSAFSSSGNVQDCRNNIEKVLCLVDPTPDVDMDTSAPDFNWDLYLQRRQELHYNRPCLAGGEKYLQPFYDHFDHSREVIQKMYCSLGKIWIEKELVSTAYASPIYKDWLMVTGAIGINVKFIESSIDMDSWLSWKEEISFGGPKEMDKISEILGLFKYTSSEKGKKQFMFDDTINHEFGHLFDYANGINNFTPGAKPEDEMLPAANSWGSISWKTDLSPLDENNFPILKELCFYRCKETLNPARAHELFDSLLGTSFNSVYGATNPYDDFAEVFSYYISSLDSDWQLSVEVQGKKHDLIAHFKSDKLKTKRDYVKKFLEGKIHYPGMKAE